MYPHYNPYASHPGYNAQPQYAPLVPPHPIATHTTGYAFAGWQQPQPLVHIPPSQLNYGNYNAFPIPPTAPINRLNVPPPTYICHRCKQHGHWITDCPMQPSQPQSSQQPHAHQKKQSFICEPCEKEFTSSHKYQAHKSSHEKCRDPNCTFEASKKVVIAHYHACHGKFKGSGYKVIDVEGQKFRGTSPDEVKEWREQRRKRFPTKANVEQKEVERNALIAAGGIVPDSSRKGRKRKLPQTSATNTAEEEVTTKALRPMEIFDSATAAPTTASSLAALAAYGESSESEEGEVSESPRASEFTVPDAAVNEVEYGTEHVLNEAFDDESCKRKKRCTYFMRGHCGKGDECPFSHDFEPKVCKYYAQGHCKKGRRCQFVHQRAANNNNTSSGNNSNTPRVKKSMGLNLPLPMQSSKLYWSLVKDQVAEEENILLQCMQYIVQRQFLQTTLAPDELEKLIQQSDALKMQHEIEIKEKQAKQQAVRPLVLDPSLLTELDSCADEEADSSDSENSNDEDQQEPSSEPEDGEVFDSEDNTET